MFSYVREESKKIFDRTAVAREQDQDICTAWLCPCDETAHPSPPRQHTPPHRDSTTLPTETAHPNTPRQHTPPHRDSTLLHIESAQPSTPRQHTPPHRVSAPLHTETAHPPPLSTDGICSYHRAPSSLNRTSLFCFHSATFQYKRENTYSSKTTHRLHETWPLFSPDTQRSVFMSFSE
jgi:hypothetical protein